MKLGQDHTFSSLSFTPYPSISWYINQVAEKHHQVSQESVSCRL